MKTYRLHALIALFTVAACGGSPPPPASAANSQVTDPAASSAASPAPAASAPSAPAATPPKAMFDLQLASLRAYVAAFNRHDAKAVAALYAPEAVFIERGTPGNAGPAAIAANYQNYFDTYPDVTTAITRSWHWGDAALFEYVEGGTQTGQRIVLPPPPQHLDPMADATEANAKTAPDRESATPTGKKFGYVGASLLRFTPDGLVRQDMTYSDELTREVQSGWAPGMLAKMPVRPIIAVPAANDTWETHQAGAADGGQPKLLAAKASLYNKFSLNSEKAFLAGLTDDVVLAAYDDPKDATGKREAAALLKDWTTTFADGVVDAKEGWSVDGYVVLMGVYTGKHVGAWGPLKPTHSTFKTHFLDIAKLGSDDKLQHLWSYANNYELLQYLDYKSGAVASK